MELYSYYRLDERDSESVSGIWKGLHIFLLVTAVIFSIVCIVFFHILLASFDMNCILYPKTIVLLNSSYPSHREPPTSNTTYNQIDLPIDFIKSKWSDMNVCYTSIYNPIFSVIYGIIWMTFFLMCSKGGKSYSGLAHPWRIVLPSTIFIFIYSIICINVSQVVTEGFTEFEDIFKNTTGIDLPIYKYEVGKIEMFVFVTIISSWLYTSSWLVAFILLIMRCIFFADFQLIKVKVELIEGGNEIAESNKDAIVAKSTDPSISYHTPSTSKEIIKPNSILTQANIEHVKVDDSEDPSAFDDFNAVSLDSDDFGTPPQGESSHINESLNQNIVMPKVMRSVSFVPFDIQNASLSDSSLSEDDSTAFLKRK